MVGNQTIINSKLEKHPKNPIKEPVNGIDPSDIIHIITDELWRSWRKDLVYSHHHEFKMLGLGTFKLRHGKAKSFLRYLIKRVRELKRKYADTYQKEGTRGYALYNAYLRKLRDTWIQVDTLKDTVNETNARFNKVKRDRFGDKAIIQPVINITGKYDKFL